MSSKQDLMDYINNQDDCSIVKTTYVETKPDGSKRYRFSVCKEGVDSAIFENKEIYVWDEGEPNEKALWLGRKPYVVSDTSESFVNRLHTFIQSKINDNSIQAAFVDNADEKTK